MVTNGSRLRRARERARLSQAELARLAGLRAGAVIVSDLELGRSRNPKHETVTRLVRALRRAGLKNLTADKLFPVPDEPQPEVSACP